MFCNIARGNVNENPLVSIIVPVWNSPELVAKCLRALSDQTYPNVEIVVVDNGSTDMTRDVVSGFHGVKLLYEPNPGSYRARNKALEVVRGDLVAFTDADCVPDREWVAAAVRAAMRQPDAGIWGGRVDLFRADNATTLLCEKYERLFAFDQSLNISRGVCVTANWMSRRSVMRDVGGFNAALKSGGDTDCSKRIAAAGYPLVYVDDMIVMHPVRGTVFDLVKKRRRIVGGEWMSHSGPGRFLRLLPGTLKRTARSMLKASTSNLRISIRIGIIGVVLRLMMVELAERLRLSFGGEPRRA